MAGPPVLAVRPFMGERRHLWCGEMSLPGYYERSGRPEAARRHSFPTDLVAAAASRGDSSDSVVGGRATVEVAAPPAATAAVFVPQPQPPRWTSFRGNSWQQELDAVRYLLDIDDGRLESAAAAAGTTAGSRRPGSVVSCRTECVSPDGPLKALPRYGFSPTIHDREVKTRAESDVNRANSLTAKTVKPLAGAARRRREPRRDQQQRWQQQQQQLIVPPQPSVVDRSRRSQPATGHRHCAADDAADGSSGDRRAHATEQSLEELYRQMLSGGGGGDRGSSDETLPFYDDAAAAVVALTSMPAGTSAACQSAAAGAADVPVPTATIVINSSSVDDTYAHSAGAAEARASFRLLRSHAGPRTAVEQALEREFALLVRREPDARRAPRASFNAGAHARLLRPANGAQTHGELFIHLSRDLNGGAIARQQPSQQQRRRGQWPQTSHAVAPWQPRRAATYADGFSAFGMLPEYGAAAAAERLSTADGAGRLRESSAILALGQTPMTTAFPSIVG